MISSCLLPCECRRYWLEVLFQTGHSQERFLNYSRMLNWIFKTTGIIDSYILIGLIFTEGKKHQTLLLLIPQGHALSVIWWFCGCIPIDFPDKMTAGLVHTYVFLHHWVLLFAVPVSCVTHPCLHYTCFHTRSHSSALWQLCRGIEHWKECCSLAKSTFTSASALCYPL